MPNNPGKLIVISGPSGVGKSTITKEVLRRTGARYSVSATTRKARPGEVDGREYYFVDRRAFDDMIERGALLEWADVFGNYYGTPAEPVRKALDAGQNVVLEIDVQGGIQVRKKAADALFVLILPPNDKELERRLRGRGTETPEALARRLSAARAEIELAKSSGIYDHCVTNDNLENAVDQVVQIVNKEIARR